MLRYRNGRIIIIITITLTLGDVMLGNVIFLIFAVFSV